MAAQRSDAKGDLRGAAGFYEKARVPHTAALRLMQLAVAHLCPGGQPLLPVKSPKLFLAAAYTATQLFIALLQLRSLPSNAERASDANRAIVELAFRLSMAIAHGEALTDPSAEAERWSSAISGLAQLESPCDPDMASRFLAAAYTLDAVAVQLHSVSASEASQSVAGSRSQAARQAELLTHAVRAWGSLRSTASAFLRACQQLARGSVEGREAAVLGACEPLLGVATDPQRPWLRVVWDRKTATWLPAEVRSGGKQVRFYYAVLCCAVLWDVWEAVCPVCWSHKRCMAMLLLRARADVMVRRIAMSL